MASNDPQAPMANADDAETEQKREHRGPPPVEAMPGAEELLRQAELKAQEHHDAWLRAKAETENVRKRAQIDVANAHKYAIEKFALELLPVKDSLEAALAAGTATADAIKSGVEITLKQLNAVFEKANLKEINPA